MPRIFISYRRADSQMITDRIYDYLVEVFGKENIFKDVDSIELSRDFRAAIERAIINAEVVLIVIGKQWASIQDKDGNQRLNNTSDSVRIEVEMAQRHAQMVIPVTVDGAGIPSEAELPTSLYPVIYKNAANVRNDPDFERDMERVVRSIRRQFPELSIAPKVNTSPPPTRIAPIKRSFPTTLIATIATVITLIVVVVLVLNNNQPPTADEIATQTAQAIALAVTDRLTITTEGDPTTNSLTLAATAIEKNTDAPTLTPSLTRTPTYTHTPIPTLSGTEIELTIQGEMIAVLNEGTRTAEAEQIKQAATTEAEQTNQAFVANAETATSDAALTATATRWTATPTVDARGTVFARLTETQNAIDSQRTADAYASATGFFVDQTMTATQWTPTSTYTATHTPTSTYTPTITPTPTNIPISGLDVEDIVLGKVFSGRCIGFNPDGTLLATTAGVYELSTGQQRFPVKGYVEFSLNGRLVAISGDGVYDLATNQKLFSITEKPITFSPNSTLLAISNDGVYRIDTQEKLFSIDSGGIFSPDGKLLAVSYAGVYKVETGEKLFHIGDVVSSFSNDSHWLATGDSRIYDLTTGESQFKPVQGSGLSLPFSPDESLVAIGNRGLYKTETGELLFDKVGSYPVFSPNGNLLASSIGVSDVFTGQILFETATGYRRSFSPDGKLLAVGNDGVYGIATKQKLFDIQGLEPQFSPDGTLLVTSETTGCKVYGKFESAFSELTVTATRVTGTVQPLQVANIRNAPSINASVVATASSSQTLTVFARTSDSQWYRVDTNRWIAAVAIREISIPANLPVENP